ncbi:DUF192 domain-containing protein [Halobacteriovorax sp. JY17]|uniref:DUF192 domain-containing protein n=1 Tax=Halobacteriovorax sp. JY17 TaxID=2014617 RepID=UPI000C4D805D|nr:DUF192 domain-containing protein [Halobacteriovorax sp. JY17]PIK14114.1 MAG: hypothetical protein CES88_14120 [Halobacteriovorax sp. JY17]
MSMQVKFKEIVLCEELKIADDFFSRLIGLMFKKKMIGFDGLLIKQCNSIHTFFMRYALDIVFLNKEMKVVKVIENIKPWRMTLMYLKSSQVLELKSGTLNNRLKKEDQLEIVCIN